MLPGRPSQKELVGNMERRKTDMFSLGFICEIKKFETPTYNA
jgi:hypothetical protein